MKKYLLFCFILNILMFVSCAPEEANVKIKAGVIMKSGDVKNVARQEFIIAKTDVVSLWEASKEKHLKGVKLIEKEIKAETDYENKMNNFENTINKIKKAMEEKQSKNSQYSIELKEKLKSYFKENLKYEKELWPENLYTRGRLEKLSDLYDILGLKAVKNIVINPYLQRLDSAIKNIRDYPWDRDDILEYKTYYDGEKTKIISLTFNPEEAWEVYKDREEALLNIWNDSIRKIEINKDLDNIEKIEKKKSNLKKEIQLEVKNQIKFLKNKSRRDFQMELKDKIVKLIRTDLNGEASLKIEKGQYFLFAVAQVGQKNIIWNFNIDIEGKERFIELSNDNAYSIDNKTLFFDLREALEGIESKEDEATGGQD